MTPTIRQASPADLPQILTQIRALSAFHGQKASVTLETLQARIFGQGATTTVWMAEAAGAEVGYAALVMSYGLHDEAPRADIQHLYVADGWRGCGVGRALIGVATERAKTLGADRLFISTDPDNLSAQASYRAMGFKELTGRGPRFRIF